MTTATEVLGSTLGEGANDSLLMMPSGYDGPSEVGAGLHAIHRYKWNPKPASSSFASGSSAYQLKLGLTAVRSPAVGLDDGSWRSLAFTRQRVSGPIQFVLKLLESWCLSRDDAVLLLGFDQTDNDLVRAILNGAADLHGRDIRDRIVHLFHIRATLSSLFRDLDVENEWLREQHTLLDGREPLKLLLGGSMEDLLLVKEYVDAAAGR